MPCCHVLQEVALVFLELQRMCILSRVALCCYFVLKYIVHKRQMYYRFRQVKMRR